MSITINAFTFLDNVWKNGQDGITREQYTDAVIVLNTLKKWEWIREIEPTKGFQFTQNEVFNLITQSLDMSNHTGFTAVFMFRKIKEVADVLIKRKEHMCAICLSEDTGKFIMFECEHRFHKECISNKGIRICPLCRGETIPDHFQ